MGMSEQLQESSKCTLEVTELQLPKYSEIEHKWKSTKQKGSNRIKESKIEIVWCQKIHHQYHP